LRVSIIVSDDDGNTYQGEVDLPPAAPPRAPRKRATRELRAAASTSLKISFASPIRAFVKRYARDMSGPQKFALLTVYLSKGDAHKQVLVNDVKRHWNNMKPLLGGKFNLAYTIRARESEWVDSPKRGVYVVMPGWKGIFGA
jgi:hypothetical protein